MTLPPLGTTGKDKHPAFVSGDAGRGGTFPLCPLFIRLCGGRRWFSTVKNRPLSSTDERAASIRRAHPPPLT